MRKIKLGFLLVLMMVGHNYVLNQTQAMQKPLEEIHSINVTSFNLLYSIPSAISILFIIPMGFFYEKLSNKLLWMGAILLSLGQLLVAVFGGSNQPFYYQLLMLGRIFEGVGAEVLYMIQGNMASSWMGRYAGVVFILPQFGQIANVFLTPWSYTNFGISTAFFIGFIVCIISSCAALGIYYGLSRYLSTKVSSSEQELKINEHVQTHNNSGTQKQIRSSLNDSSPGKEDTLDLTVQELSQVTRQPKSLFQAGQITWLVLILCGVNECLYFPFLDNANQLVTNRFCIPYEDTGIYLAIPFIAAMVASGISTLLIPLVERHKLILYISVMPLLGHSLIFFDVNCQSEPTVLGRIMLVMGMTFFGLGIGTYYSISFPAVGLSVPRQIRGMAYACMAFFQTISMTLIPIFAGLIIESEEKITKLSEGYKEESLLFVVICIVGVLVSFLIYHQGSDSSFMYNDEDQLNTDHKSLINENSVETVDLVEMP